MKEYAIKIALSHLLKPISKWCGDKIRKWHSDRKERKAKREKVDA